METQNTLMDHFSFDVSDKVKDKLLAIAKEAENEVFSKLIDSYGCIRIEPIGGVSYSGFIPFQNGGYEVSEFSGSSLGSGRFITDLERNWYETLQTNCEKDFRSDNEIEDETELTYEQIDALCEYEQDYFEEQASLLRFETWIEQDNETVFLRLSLGYKDAPYFRSKYDETIKEISLNVNELLEKDVSDLVKPFAEAI